MPDATLFEKVGDLNARYSLEWRDDDVSREQQVMEQDKSDTEAYQQNLQHYESKFSQEVDRELPLRDETRHELKQLQQQLGLQDEDVVQIEQQIFSKVREQEKAYQNKLQRYEQRLMQIVELEFPPGEFARYELRNLQKSLGLRDSDVQQVERAAMSLRQADLFIKQQQQLEQPKPESANETEHSLELEQPPTVIQMSSGEVESASESASESSPEPEEGRSPESPVVVKEFEPLLSQLLASEKGVDYTRLRNLLQESQWREADEETLAVMLKASGREKEGWLDRMALVNFPCTDLHTIDQLWMHYSNNHFGFSVQYQVYVSLNKREAALMGDRVGWWHKRMRIFLPYSSLKFSPQAPEGHLPAFWFWKIPVAESFRAWGVGYGRAGCATDSWMIATLMSRLENCPQ